MPIQGFSFELKSLSAEGQFEGWAATYDVDQGGDRIIPGAFQETLRNGKSRPLLYEHKSAVGTVDLLEDPQHGLYAKGYLTMAVQQARDVYELVKSGAVGGLSIGYAAVRESYQGAIRQLAEIKIFEVSLTCMPMNAAAMVTAVKSRRMAEAEAITRAAEDLRRFYGQLKTANF